MAFTPEENVDLRDYGVLADGGTVIIARFPVAERTIADLGLSPGNTLPQETKFDNAGDAGIVGGRYELRPGMRYAVITAHLPSFFQSVQTRSGTADGAYVDPTTTITATAPIFYPSLVGETVTFDSVDYTVASYVSPTVITVTANATGTAKTITFDEGSRLLTEATSDGFGWQRDGWWTVVRRWLCETGDREAEMQYLKTTTFTFDGDTNSVVGYPSGASSRGRDPTYPHKGSITMSFEAPIYDV